MMFKRCRSSLLLIIDNVDPTVRMTDEKRMRRALDTVDLNISEILSLRNRNA
jgi:hypothetical protein